MPDDLKGFLRRFYDDVNAGRLSVLDDLLADDLVEHDEFPGLEPNKEGVKQLFATFRLAFPDLRLEAQEMIAEGDLVCARVITTGTHQGEFIGIQPTGRRIEVEMIDIVRVRDGQVIEHWGMTDTMAMMEQLGATPEQAPA